MNEQWEICSLVINTLPQHFIEPDTTVTKKVHSPSGFEATDFMFSEYDQLICDLLADGWEPYNGIKTFRRRFS